MADHELPTVDGEIGVRRVSHRRTTARASAARRTADRPYAYAICHETRVTAGQGPACSAVVFPALLTTSLLPARMPRWIRAAVLLACGAAVVADLARHRRSAAPAQYSTRSRTTITQRRA